MNHEEHEDYYCGRALNDEGTTLKGLNNYMRHRGETCPHPISPQGIRYKVLNH